MTLKNISSVVCLLLGFCLMISCSDDDPAKEREINEEETPYYVSAFLKNTFPDDTPEKIIKLESPDIETGTQYIATFPNGVKVEFDGEGVWLQVLSLKGISLSEFSGTLLWDGMKDVVKESYGNQAITGYKKLGDAYYIVSVENQLQLLFVGNSLIGSLFTEYEQLPGKVRQFITDYFPQSEYELLAESPKAEAFDPAYHIWLTDSYRLAFNTEGDMVRIEGEEELLIPETIIRLLPEKLQEDLQRLYPDAQITQIYRTDANVYEVRVYPHVTYSYDPERYTVVWPNEQISAFIETYFGKFNHLVYTSSYTEKQPKLTVIIPNGFDLSVTQSGEWTVVDGHGHPFPESLYDIVPASILQYVKGKDPEMAVTTIDRTVPYGYLVVLTNGQTYTFDYAGNPITEEVVLTPYQRIVNYIRYRYPEEVGYRFVSWSANQYMFYLEESDTELLFDSEGNLIR